jgi:Methyltransferase domain
VTVPDEAHAQPDSAPVALGDTALQARTLENNASRTVNYRDWLTSLALPYLGDHPVELGSGLGNHAQVWLDKGVPRITVSDVEPGLLDELRLRFAEEPRVDVRTFDVLAPPAGDYSALVAYNVLEHIPDHVGALRGGRSLVRPGGAVIMLVPAFEFAMSRFDRLVGHQRRYTVGSLAEAFTDAGLDTETVHYVNMPGLLAWFVLMRLLRKEPDQGRLVSIWDNQVIPRVRRWEEGHRAWFGQSVFGVARVPAR